MSMISSILRVAAFRYSDGEISIVVHLPDGRTLCVEADEEYIEGVIWDDDPHQGKALVTPRPD